MLISKFPMGIKLETAQVTNLSASVIANTPGSLNVSWTNPMGQKYFRGVLIRYKTGGYPTNPTDGVQAYNGIGTGFTLTGLTGGTQYYFRAFAYAGNNSGTKIVYNTETIGAQALARTISSPVTNLAVATISNTSGSLALLWTTPAGLYSSVTIVRKAGSYPTSRTDGTPIFFGTGTSYTDTGLTGGTQYYYRAFVYNSEVWNDTTSQEATAKTHSAPVTNLAVNAVSNTSGSLIITWTAPTGSYTVVKIISKAGSYPTSDTDGISVYSGIGTSYINTGLTGGTAYYYRAFVSNGSVWNNNTSQEASNMTEATPVTISFASKTTTSITVNFSGCSDPARGVYLVIKAGSYPTNATDGTQFYVAWNTAGGAATASGLTSGTTYYIRGFVHNGNNVWNDDTAQELSAVLTKVAAGQLVFTSSQVWSIPLGISKIDIFCVGAGGGGSGGNYWTSDSAVGGSGGGGGYTSKLLNATVAPESQIAVTVGYGGEGGYNDRVNRMTGLAGGASSFGNLLTANGGNGAELQSTTMGSANGGSGGGAGSESWDWAGQGGTDGGNGWYGGESGPTDHYIGTYQSLGQGTTTRAFAEVGNTLYSGGGGGGGPATSSYYRPGPGGDGGGGQGGTAGVRNASNGTSGTPNTGGGGGGTGGNKYSNNSNKTLRAGNGGSGIVIIRWVEQG